MIIALSACVGVSIMVSWCRRHHPVGKMLVPRWPVVSARTSQQFSRCPVVLVSGGGCLDSRHTLTHVFLALHGHQCCKNQRGHFSDLRLSAHMADSRTVRPLALIPWDGTRPTDLKRRFGRHTCGLACDSAALPAWWRLFMPKVAVVVGSLLCLNASSKALHHLCCTSNDSLLGLNKGYWLLCNQGPSVQKHWAERREGTQLVLKIPHGHHWQAPLVTQLYLTQCIFKQILRSWTHVKYLFYFC